MVLFHQAVIKTQVSLNSTAAGMLNRQQPLLLVAIAGCITGAGEKHLHLYCSLHVATNSKHSYCLLLQHYELLIRVLRCILNACLLLVMEYFYCVVQNVLKVSQCRQISPVINWTFMFDVICRGGANIQLFYLRQELMSLLINLLIICPSKFPRGQSDTFRLLILFSQPTQTPHYSV